MMCDCYNLIYLNEIFCLDSGGSGGGDYGVLMIIIVHIKFENMKPVSGTVTHINGPITSESTIIESQITKQVHG